MEFFLLTAIRCNRGNGGRRGGAARSGYQVHPGNISRANRLLIAGKVTRARELFRQLTRENPRSDQTAIGLSRVYLMEEKNSEAIAWGNKTVELNPDDDRAWLLQGEVWNRMGEAEKAKKSFARARELDPDAAIDRATGDQGLKTTTPSSREEEPFYETILRKINALPTPPESK